MSFIEQIVTQREIEGRFLRLKSNDAAPLVLYGAGVYASEIEEFLSLNGIKLEGCFVDPEFLDGAHAVKVTVESFDALCHRLKQFRVIIAHCNDPRAAFEKINKNGRECVSKVLFFDCRFWKSFRNISLEYIRDNSRGFESFYSWLCDDKSRRTLIEFINVKLMHDPLKLYPLWSKRHYFPEDLVAFQPNENDCFIDAGAFTGDTLMDYLFYLPDQRCKGYIALEPDPVNAKELGRIVSGNNWDCVRIEQCGLWSSNGQLRFTDKGNTTSMLSFDGDIEIVVKKLDSLGVEPSFIKMDIEGAELDALRGGERTICQFKPKLAISLYHNLEDFIEIPSLLKSFNPGYSFYLRLHSPFTEELVLYAVDSSCSF